MFSRALRVAVAAAALASTPVTVTATQPGDATAQPPGKKLYRRFCIQCHGTRPARLARLDRQSFGDAVSRGINLMPPFGSRLSDAEIETIWRFVASRPLSP